MLKPCQLHEYHNKNLQLRQLWELSNIRWNRTRNITILQYSAGWTNKLLHSIPWEQLSWKYMYKLSTLKYLVLSKNSVAYKTLRFFKFLTNSREELPFDKSFIRLRIYHTRLSALQILHIEMKWTIVVDTHNSNREVRLDKVDGIGPSRLVPSNLLKRHLEVTNATFVKCKNKVKNISLSCLTRY